jgi:ketosteroid isomerase-like protein
MKRVLTAMSLLASLTSFAAAQEEKKVDVAAQLRAMVAAERAFSKLAGERGTRAAFLDNMTDDACVFGPGVPSNGKRVWTARPERPGLLSWEPTYADMARSGEMGWTTGPWEFRPKGASDAPVAFGEFMTVWVRQPDGRWKWVLDTGISHAARAGAPPSLEFSRDFRQNTDRDKTDVSVEKTKNELLKVEREFSAASSRDTRAAFLAYADEDVRVLREGIFPALGKANIGKALEASPGTMTWQVTQTGAARSGELGYSLGVYELRAPRRSATRRASSAARSSASGRSAPRRAGASCST